MIDHRFKREDGRGRKRTPLKYMPLGTFGEENQPYGVKQLARYPADHGQYGSRVMTVMRYSGREKHF
jgi:hypothetical protein